MKTYKEVISKSYRPARVGIETLGIKDTWDVVLKNDPKCVGQCLVAEVT